MKRILLTLTLGALIPGVGCRHSIPQVVAVGNWTADSSATTRLVTMDAAGNGIEVGEAKIYDEASLRLMLDQARQRLAAINGLNEASLTTRLGSVTGARIEQSQFGLQASGPPVPGTTVTDKGATQQTTTNTNLPSPTTLPGQVTVATLPTHDVQTITSAMNAPASPTVPAGIAFSAPSGQSVSALDLLNEQMQLTYELANLQLLLEGALSDRFVKNQRLIKPRTTIGFPISLTPRPAYRDAVAVVEVEVETAPESLTDPNLPEPPAILALLPREKTYNVAAIKDRMTSIGGGAVIGIVGVAGSWVSGRKSYFLVQDQDTVAIQRSAPSDKPNSVAFAWEFRPVLGQPYVRGGLKQTFVQLSLPLLPHRNCFGAMRLRTYWRRYDRNTGVAGKVIPETVLVSKHAMSIPHFDLTPFVDSVSYQDLGDGNLMVRVAGTFLSGTYVQVGPLRFDVTKNLQVEDSGLTFIVPATALARWTARVVSRGGESAEIVEPLFQERLEALDQYGCGDATRTMQTAAVAPQAEVRGVKVAANERAVQIVMGQSTASAAAGVPASGVYGGDDAAMQRVAGATLHRVGSDTVVWSAPIVTAPGCPGDVLRIASVTALTLNEKESELTVDFKRFAALQSVLLEVGGKVYGLSDTVVRRQGEPERPTMILTVPTSLLVSNPRVKAFVPFQFVAEGARTGAVSATCSVDSAGITGFGSGASMERLVLVSVGADGAADYLLLGSGLEGILPIVPESAKVTKADGTAVLPTDTDADVRVRRLKITKSDLATTKKVVLMKKGALAPIVLDLPALDAKPPLPKVTIDSPVIQNVDVLEVQVENAEQLTGVKFGGKSVPYDPEKGFLRLKQLQALGVTTVQKGQELTFEFGETKVSVKFEVVAARIGVK